ncbi:type 1 glutamine amidotransferase [Patescibacteria group bacterium]|nr:type 1 glutamine amidotransferase [Patescibacteria group bacterium]
MQKKKSELKILYIQIREDQVTCDEELDEFVRFSELSKEQFTILNVFKTREFEPNVADGHDAVFVGGSSDASVLEPEKYTFVESCKKLLVCCCSNNIPTFASCFGFQIAVDAFGGTVIDDRENMEMGTYEITLSEEGERDRLFKDVPKKFWAVSGHQKRTLTLPDSMVNLASTESCPYHCFVIKGKPFYGFQFHPEVDKKDLIGRITRYQERYLDDDGSLQRIIESAVETPFANDLVRKFVNIIILKGE